MRHSLTLALLLSLLLAPVRGQTVPRPTRSLADGGGAARVKGTERAASGQSSGGTYTLEGSFGQSNASAAGGTYTLQSAIGQPLAGTSSGGTFTVQYDSLAAPLALAVQSVVRASANPAVQNSSVDYTVNFNAPVTGVDAADFQLTTNGLTGASVTGVTGSGSTYNVTVETGTPAAAGATLRLDLVDDDSITDSDGRALGGTGSGNGNFNAGEVYTVNPNFARANDARIYEPTAGSASMLFTVTLSAPAPAGGVSLSYATASGGANPATEGASCGGVVDYVPASGALNFAAGEQFKTVPVNVCADTDAGESAETLLLNLSGASGATIQRGTANGTILQGPESSSIIISELRTSGPGGAGDDFVELYNTSDFDQDISGFGVFKMGATCADTPVLVATIPGAVGSNTTVLQGRAHYLIVGSQYSLANHGGTGAAAGDLSMTSDIEDDRNVGLFSTSDVTDLSTITRYDAVGFGANVETSSAVASRAVARRSFKKGVKADVLSAAPSNGVCNLLREGNTLPAVSGSAAEHSFFRTECGFVGGVGCTAGGNPKDTNDNAADFTFADTQATFIAGVTQKLGAPGPENRSSPVRRDTSGVGAALLDGSASSSSVPNRVRSFTSDSANNSTFGTLTIRRRVFNNTGGNVTRLRFRIVEMTTFPSPAGTADLRARTGVNEVSVGPVGDATTCAAAGAGTPPCNVSVLATTLEEPPGQPNGGGVNSTLSAGTVTLATPLANGASLNVSFLLGVQQTGTFRFLIIIEALP
jgi:hypothetical protein